MNRPLVRIRQRREALILRAQAQRQDVRTIARAWHRPFQFADTTVAGLRRMSRLWPWGAVVLAIALRHRHASIGRWLGRVWGTWKFFRALRPRLLTAPPR